MKWKVEGGELRYQLDFDKTYIKGAVRYNRENKNLTNNTPNGKKMFLIIN